MKMLRYADQSVTPYFWRTTQQQEIDLIEEHEGSEWKAFGFKWKGNERVRFPQTFTDNYPGASTATVLPKTVEDFLLQRR